MAVLRPYSLPEVIHENTRPGIFCEFPEETEEISPHLV